MKSLILLLLALFVPILNAQQTGVLKGTVTARDRAPIVNANIFIKELERGAASSGNGTYLIQNIPPGVYTIVTSSVGFATVSRVVKIIEGQTVEVNFALAEETIELPTVVVTGTRTEKELSATPIATAFVSQKEIARIGARDLKNILAEQTGLALIDDHGTGIQVQGFDPAYTLILVDGEPIIGRTAGTLELSRLSVGNVRQIEIVKGPSSSLYGSEALAGVINVITQKPQLPLALSVLAEYGSHDAVDLNATAEFSNDNVGAVVFVDRKRFGGYNLTNSVSPTVAPATDYTFNPKLYYSPTEHLHFSIASRYYTSLQESNASVTENSSQLLLDNRSWLSDWSVTPGITYHITPELKLAGKVHATSYQTQQTLEYQTGGEYSRSTFNQSYVKEELQLDALIHEQHIMTAGVGYIQESVEAERISGGKRNSRSLIAFAQEEWMPSSVFDIIASARYDAHSDYASRLSPKIAALVKPYEWLHVRLAIGSGFKAPTFQQLYLDFANPTAGYSVFGSTGVQEGINRLQQDGQIQQVLINPTALQTIKPEYSVSFNSSLEFYASSLGTLKVNLFRNNVRDLIETAPVAVKTNGQSVFTYFNLNKIYTQGMESELTLTPFEHFDIAVGYQYLDAKDEQVLDEIRAGRISKVGSTGRIRPVQEVEYGGLFNRSNHSGTLKLTCEVPSLGLTAALRGIVRGRYGYSDRNANGILDDDSEYAPGYALWNLTVSQTLFERLTMQAGVENMFDKTNTMFLSSLPGRTFSLRVSYRYY
ncbi:MAG: TonB-dependent receptor [Ignavibacteriae bacterium]|nr:TonB-dependent receptor [Ignavibacteriota bacterium]